MSCKKLNVVMRCNVVLISGVCPATIVKKTNSGNIIWVKYNLIYQYHVFKKYKDFEVIKYNNDTRIFKPLVIMNNEYNVDYLTHEWIEFEKMRLAVLKNQYMNKFIRLKQDG